MHSTGLAGITKVGAVSGQVSASQPPAQFIISEPFTATFAVDNDLNGTGSFTVGDNTYKCKVSPAN